MTRVTVNDDHYPKIGEDPDDCHPNTTPVSVGPSRAELAERQQTCLARGCQSIGGLRHAGTDRRTTIAMLNGLLLQEPQIEHPEQ